MITFQRDRKTGKLLVFKDGKPHGEMLTMGDDVKKEPEKKPKKKEEE